MKKYKLGSEINLNNLAPVTSKTKIKKEKDKKTKYIC